jgi:hypothetical protein
MYLQKEGTREGARCGRNVRGKERGGGRIFVNLRFQQCVHRALINSDRSERHANETKNGMACAPHP